MEQPSPRPYRVKEAAEALGVHPLTVWRWCRRGVLPSTRLGSTYLIPRHVVQAVLEGKPILGQRPE